MILPRYCLYRSKWLVSPFPSHSACLFLHYFLSLSLSLLSLLFARVLLSIGEVNEIPFSHTFGLYHSYQSSMLVLCITLIQSSLRNDKSILVVINQYHSVVRLATVNVYSDLLCMCEFAAFFLLLIINQRGKEIVAKKRLHNNDVRKKIHEIFFSKRRERERKTRL